MVTGVVAAAEHIAIRRSSFYVLNGVHTIPLLLNMLRNPANEFGRVLQSLWREMNALSLFKNGRGQIYLVS